MMYKGLMQRLLALPGRRRALAGLAALPLAGVGTARAQTGKAAPRTLDVIRHEWRTFLPAGASVPEPKPPLTLSKDEWKKRLTPAQYRVLREEGTEPAGSSPLDREKRRGVFACAGCGLALFTSEMKYDSGTGWPSFFTTIPGVFGTKQDYYLLLPRTEYHCIRCGGHHGHVFDDGPPPTRQRWCNNGLALTFLPA
jgi:peptide-methionine (R)-S-oxide reductase